MGLSAVVKARSYAATLCLPSSGTMRGRERLGKGSANVTAATCIRCGGGDHSHERCRAEGRAVIWGIDWKTRRKHRKRCLRGARQKWEGSMKPTSCLLREVENGVQRGILKRLQPKTEPYKVSLGANKGLRQEMQLKEVARDKAERLRAMEEACGEQVASGSTSQESPADVMTVF
jgi:hypothetical protein